jgi:hypothetical protein
MQKHSTLRRGPPSGAVFTEMNETSSDAVGVFARANNHLRRNTCS